MSDWSIWKADRTHGVEESLKQMAEAGVTDLYVDTENTRTMEGLRVTFYLGEKDGKPVVQIDGSGDFRINVNDGAIWDQHTDAPRNYFPDIEDHTSGSMILAAALHMYQMDIASDYDKSYTYAQMVRLRSELLAAGFTEGEVDGNGSLVYWFDDEDAHVAHRIEGELKVHDSFEEMGYDVELFHPDCAEEGRKLFVAINEEDDEVRAFELDVTNLPECPVCKKTIGGPADA